MTHDMTTGTPWKHIVLFAIPLLLGNIFQSSYNLIDTAVVGRFAGPLALAGVGVASPIFNLLNALLIGLSIGSGIVISQIFGAKKMEDMPKAVSTILWISLGLSAILVAVGQVVAVPLLRILQTPVEDMADATVYLRFIICGLVCSVFYNQLTGMLRGLGNTKVPLYILIFSSVLNIALDLLFVATFRWGVAGAAVATIISQGASAILTAIYIAKYIPELHLHGSRGIDKEMAVTTFRFGFPMGLQQASICIGHVLLQGIINPFGSAMIAAFTAGAKVDMFAVMPMISISSAMSTYSAQNCGAGKPDRIKQGVKTGIIIVLVICAILACVVAPLRYHLIGIFVSLDAYPELATEIIRIGGGMLICTSLFYWLLAPIHVLINTMAGAGDPMFSMKTMIGMMFLRIAFAWCFIHLLGMAEFGVWYAFPTSWGVTVVFVIIHFVRGKWMKKLPVTAKESE